MDQSLVIVLNRKRVKLKDFSGNARALNISPRPYFKDIHAF
jgi:hypothetical protein